MAAKTPSAFGLATLYRDLGEIEKSMEFLEKAPDEHASNLIFLRSFPPWKPLWKHPRFPAVLKRVGLDPPRLIAPW